MSLNDYSLSDIRELFIRQSYVIIGRKLNFAGDSPSRSCIGTIESIHSDMALAASLRRAPYPWHARCRPRVTLRIINRTRVRRVLSHVATMQGRIACNNISSRFTALSISSE